MQLSPAIRGFGGVTAEAPSGPIELGGPKQRAVLALLLVEPGAVISLDRIIDRVWGLDAPGRAEVSVRGYISNLRKALAAAGLGDGAIEFRDRGYLLRVPPASVDLQLFEALVDDGLRLLRLDDRLGARRLLAQALELHAGTPFGPLADELGLGDVVAHFEERRGEAVEALIDVRLSLGEHAQLPAALASEIARQPYRERLRAQLALALYRSGRPVEALRSLDDARRLLSDDVGVDPGPELRHLEAAILAHDTALAWVPETEANDTPEEHEPPRPATAEVVSFGRDAEQRRCRDLLDRLVVRGGVLVVSGEAGIGKSTLLRGLRDEAEARRIPLGWDRCPESAAGAPYRSWRAASAPLLAGSAARVDPAGQRQESAAALLATHLGELERLESRGSPAVVVIDDLQWADEATLSLLGFVAGELERLRILLAVGVRRAGVGEVPPAVRDCLAELARTTDPVHIRLGGLGDSDIGTWVTWRLGRSPSPGLLAYLASLTGGNPFYVRELLALLEADGQLDGDFVARRPSSVPHTVQDVVRRRTSRLAPETQALLTVAAVIGRRFDLDLLAGVLDVGVAEALARLEPALEDGLVELDTAVVGRFAFTHALVASILVAELNPARLAGLHARTTDVLEELRAADLEPWVEDLAHHAAEGLIAGTAPKALRYALRAADHADSAQSSADVIVQLQRAVDASRLVIGHPATERRELLVRLGLALREAGAPEARPVLVEAARLAEAHGDRHALAEILGGLDSESLWAGTDWNLHDPAAVAAVERALADPELDDRDRAMLTMALAGELTYLDNARSNELFAQARALADPLGDVLLSAQILLRWYWSVSGPSGLQARAAIGDHLASLDGELPARLRPLAHLAGVSAALEVGDVARARQRVAQARALAHPLRTPTGWAHLQSAEAGLALLDDDLARARAHAAALRSALQRVRRYVAEASPAAILAAAGVQAGDTDLAIAQLAVFHGSSYSAPIRWLEAWVYAEGGRLEQARAALADFDGPLPDDWLKLPLTVAAVNAAATAGDLRFLSRHLPGLEPFADRLVFVGEGGPCLGPVALAVAAGHGALGDALGARPFAEQALAMAESTGAVFWIPRARRVLDALAPI